jgi:hypothetical protein
MSGNFFAGLLNGNIRMPDSAINYGNSPLPVLPPGASQFTTPDGRYNATGALLPGGIGAPYAYGTSARISTQTQMAHPNRVALIVPSLRIPAPESDGQTTFDPLLQHAISDGDLVFSFRMGQNMSGYGSSYCVTPYGFTAKAVQLVNLQTVNYILWGLQIGLRSPKSTRWRAFFTNLTKTGLKPGTVLDEQTVWNFIRTYLRPFGVQHGGDQQGGMHEGDDNRIVTHGAVDYVSSFAIEGKLRHVNNMWRDYDVRENDDLILALRYKKPPHGDLQFALSSSVRATRNERCAISTGFFYLRPEVLQFRSFTDVPYVHVGRSQLYCSAYTRGMEACCWDARMPVTPGAPLLLTFEPEFVSSDKMFYETHEIEEDDDDVQGSSAYGAPSVAANNNNDANNNNNNDTNNNNNNHGGLPPHALVRRAAPAAGVGRTGAGFTATTTTNNNNDAGENDDIIIDTTTTATATAAAPAAAAAAAAAVPPRPAKKPRAATTAAAAAAPDPAAATTTTTTTTATSVFAMLAGGARGGP